MKKIILNASIFSLSLAFLTDCSKKSEVSSDQKVVRMAVEGTFPPFNFTDENGNLAGFDVDIGKEICQELNWNCQFQAQKWDAMIPGLISQQYDVIMSSMAITEKRKKKVAFSNPYYLGGDRGRKKRLSL